MFRFFLFTDCFSYIIPSAIFTRILLTTLLVFSSVGGLCFTEGNSCCRVLKGLLQTFIFCFLRILDRGSVIPLIYGNNQLLYGLWFPCRDGLTQTRGKVGRATSYPGHFTSHVGENGPGLGWSALQREWLIVQLN